VTHANDDQQVPPISITYDDLQKLLKEFSEQTEILKKKLREDTKALGKPGEGEEGGSESTLDEEQQLI
jgi:hypothetical protein